MSANDPASLDTNDLQLRIQSIAEETHAMLGAEAAAPAVSAMRTAMLELVRAQQIVSPRRRYAEYDPDAQ